MGEDPAFDYTRRALKAGKYVVTANKEVMAKHGPELLALAREHGVDLLYEASVGGGIPIIAPLKRDLLANRIHGPDGDHQRHHQLHPHGHEPRRRRLRRRTQGRPRTSATPKPDPANDVEGEDARYKLAILASLAFHTPGAPADIYREGITKLTAKDFRYAAELGYAIKLLAMARADDGGIQARVHPALLPVDAPLAKVDGVLNAVQVEGDLAGRVTFQGRGAGSLPTTSAVIADVLDAAQSIIGGRRDVPAPDEAPTRILPMSELTTRYYHAPDGRGPARRPGADRHDPRRGADQHLVRHPERDARSRRGRPSLVIMTHVAKEAAMQTAIRSLEALPAVRAVGNFIRVEHL